MEILLHCWFNFNFKIGKTQVVPLEERRSLCGAVGKIE